jgi:16S rRNA (adenine1518-N6/adenine1519-N6)-dimethyltransferase
LKAEEKFELYRPKKFLGQNFLVDDNIARKIVAALEIKKDDDVIEIGPGRGALTKHIAELTDCFTAIEFDKGVYEDLLSKYGGKVRLVHMDFHEYDLEKHFAERNTSLKIIGNIPYNITSKILFRIFEVHRHIDTVVMMIQKEVAARLIARPRTKDYGILSVQTQVYCDPEVMFHVPPTAFFPKPSVKSSIVRLSFGKNRDINDLKNVETFKAVVRESFGQRRKVMSNSLKNYFEKQEINIEDISFDFTRRPETLTPQEFVKLSNDVAALRNS